MIIYKSNNWFSSLYHFHTGPTARALLRRVLLIFLYVTVVTVGELNFYDLRLKDTPSSFLGAMGILLSMLLIFRTNTAYDRFYEGRSAWGSLVNNCRNLAIYLNVVLPNDDRQSRLFFSDTIGNFPFVLRNHLRDVQTLDDLDSAVSDGRLDLSRYDHKPAGVADQLRNRIEQMHHDGLLDTSQHINVNGYLTSLMDVCGICERIKSTPIPFSYQLFIRLFIMLYVAVLPFTVIEAYGYLTIPAVVLASYILVGIEMIGEEIEEPFGMERNDLPLSQLAQLIRVNAHDILQVHLPHVEKAAAKPGFVVVS